MESKDLADMAWDYIGQEEQYQLDFRMQHGRPSPHGVPPVQLEADKRALMEAEGAGNAPVIQLVLQKYKLLDEQARSKMAKWIRSNCRFAKRA